MARVFDGDNADVIAEGVAGEIVEKRLSVSGASAAAVQVGGEKEVARTGVRHIEEP